ncbi:MAG: CaiB/BaiF CoA transferase family protein, partial [Dehalococcoidia bacterium]
GGPYCGRLLAGLGADIIKVEPPGGDESRRSGPFPGDVPDAERSGLYLHLNAGKRGGVIALPADRARLDAVLSAADVLLLSWPPRELAARALDLNLLARQFPALVVTSVTRFGLTGPRADYLGDELITSAMSGYMSLTGDPDREPIKAYGSLTAFQAGAHAAAGTLAAIRARRFTGRGQIVDAAATDAGMFMLGGVEQLAHFYGQVPRRNGTRLVGMPPQHPYPSTIRPCRDGFVHCHSNNRHRDLLGALLRDERLLEQDLLELMTGRADEIDRALDVWLRDLDRREAVRLAQEMRLPFTEVLEPGEVMEDQHHRLRGSFVVIDHPGAGPVKQPSGPIRMSHRPWRDGPAPVLGGSVGGWVDSGARHEPPLRPPANGRPLGGLRIIDFTTAVAGPLATSILGHLGAEVIKVEAPTARPAKAAGTAPLLEGAEDRSYDRIMLYNVLNLGKRGISLDVTNGAGRELFLRLVAYSDAVVQNFSPRALDNMRLHYGDLQAVRPDLVMVSMPAFGLDGPLRNRTSYGPGIDAMSGYSHLTGYADGPPMKPGNFFCDQNAAVHSAFATMAALRHRELTGEGQHVELAMIEGEFQLLADACIDYFMNGRERMRCGNDHPIFEPHGVFRCARDDTWVAISVEEEGQWRALCAAIGREDLGEDARFADPDGRRSWRGEIRAGIEEWTRRRTPTEAQELLQHAGVPAGAVVTALDLLHDPHVRGRSSLELVDVPGVGQTPYVRPAFRLSGTPVPLEKAAPGFAEDNDYVFRGLLGLSEGEVRALEDAHVTSRTPLA